MSAFQEVGKARGIWECRRENKEKEVGEEGERSAENLCLSPQVASEF